MTPPVIEIIHRIVKIVSIDYLRGMDGKREMFLHFWVEVYEGYYKPFLIDEATDLVWLDKTIKEGKVYVSEERYLEKQKT
jgi:hypothetical protein